MAISTNSLADRLDADFAPAWRPEPGDKLVGEIIAISEHAGAYGVYPIVTVREDSGAELAFHAFHTVAMNELAKQCPTVGEHIGVKYRGKIDGRGGSSYHAYAVQVDRGDIGAVNWAKYTDETPEPPASDVPGDGAEFTAEFTGAPQSDAPKHVPADDEIPF